MTSISRRTLLQGSVAGLALAITATGQVIAVTPTATALHNWFHLAADGTVTIMVNAQDMGQGAQTGVAQVLAEELGADWRAVGVQPAPMQAAFDMPGGGRWTGGSNSIRAQWKQLRLIGATARAMLVQAGAKRLNVAAAECDAEAGRVIHPASGRSLSFAELATAAAALPVPTDAPLRPRDRWRTIGQSVDRADIPAKTRGAATYASDVQIPGMLLATLRQAPVFGARLVSVDPAPALAIKGVRRVVPLQSLNYKVNNEPLVDAVAVVADNWWAAKQGLDALHPVWAGGNTALDDAAIAARFAQDVQQPGSVRWVKPEQEKALLDAHAAGMAKAVRRIQADYSVPYLAHAPMEPLSAAADVRADRVEVWAGTQFASDARQLAADLTKRSVDQVQVHVLPSGGAFGRRYTNDYVAQAVLLSQQVKAPVKLIWSREEDMRQDRYRPANATRAVAGLDAKGQLVGMRFYAADNNGTSGPFLIAQTGQTDFPDFSPPYLLPAAVSTSHQRELPIPVGAWRAPGSVANAFFFECFLDELAFDAKIDPAEYRRRLLTGNSRALRVLETVVTQSNWTSPLSKGQGRGIAMWSSHESIAAQIVQIKVEAGNRLRLERVTCAFDCGTAVNPQAVKAQGEGSIIMGLTAALFGRISIAGGAVKNGNFDDYPLLTMAQTPIIDIHLLDSPDAPIGGAGEPMTPPVGAALTNAVFAATGRRIRSQPLADHGFTVL